MVTTSGNPEGRSKGIIPKSTKLYEWSVLKKEIKYPIEDPEKELTEEEFAKKYPKQYEALNIYVETEKTLTGNNPIEKANIDAIAGHKRLVMQDKHTADAVALYGKKGKPQKNKETKFILLAKPSPLSKTSKDVYYSSVIAHEMEHLRNPNKNLLTGKLYQREHDPTKVGHQFPNRVLKASKSNPNLKSYTPQAKNFHWKYTTKQMVAKIRKERHD